MQKQATKNANRTQSRDKNTSVDPLKNLITQEQKDQIPQAAPIVVLPKSQKQNTNSSHSSSAQMSHEYAEGEWQLSPRMKQKQNKKTLVLDLDETLFHSSFKPPEQADIVLPVEIEGKICYVYVLIMHGAITFLEQLSEYCELVFSQRVYQNMQNLQ